MNLLASLCKAALAFFGYLGLHYTCAYTLPLSSAGYTVCANLAAILLSVGVFAVQARNPLAAAGIAPLPPRRLLAAVGVGIGFCLLVRLMMLTVPFPESWNDAYATRVEAVSRAPVWLRLLSTVVVAPLAEEWVFRGLIFRTLKNGMPRFLAILASSLVFAALHGTIVWMLYTLFLGILLCVLYECTHSLWACILCHVAFNLAGQIPFVGILPHAVTFVIFSGGAAVFVSALGWLLFARQPHTR